MTSSIRTSRTPQSLPECLETRQRAATLPRAALCIVLLLACAGSAFAADQKFNLPVFEEFICPAIKYFKGVLAPFIAACVFALLMIGWKMGFVKPWGILFNIILALSLLGMGFKGLASYSNGVAKTCLESSELSGVN